METVKTPESEDFPKRVEEFMKKYKALTEEYDIDYIQYPIWIPGEKQGEFKTIIQTSPIDLKMQRLNQSFLQK